MFSCMHWVLLFISKRQCGPWAKKFVHPWYKLSCLFSPFLYFFLIVHAWPVRNRVDLLLHWCAAHQQFTAPTQGSLPTGIYLLSHLQGLGGGYVHISRNNHQANGLLSFDELVNKLLDLKWSMVQQIHIVRKFLLTFGSVILTLNSIGFCGKTNRWWSALNDR